MSLTDSYRVRFALLLICGLPGYGQSTSTLTGQVMDTTGAAIPGAKVTITAVETGVKRVTATSAEGYFTMPSLPP
nr:carboxypeptidase-like regulatory domain-containing protein [Bryobacter sp.]